MINVCLHWGKESFCELQGKPIDFAGVDESTARWVQDFSVKPYATPAKLESIDGEDSHFTATWLVSFLLLLLGLCSFMSWRPFPGARYQALLIPDCPGALNDLAHSGSLHRILTQFISQHSECGDGLKSALHVIWILDGVWLLLSHVCRARLCSGTRSVGTVLRHWGAEVDLQWLQSNRG